MREPAVQLAVARVRLAYGTWLRRQREPREAREIFPDTVVPKDFDVVEVPFAERGTPQLVKGGALHRPEPEAVSSAPQ